MGVETTISLSLIFSSILMIGVLANIYIYRSNARASLIN